MADFDERENLRLALETTDDFVQSLVQDNVKIRGRVARKRWNELTAAAKQELDLIDFAIGILNGFELVFKDRDDHGLYTVWPGRANQTSTSFYFRVLFESIADSLQSIKQLLRSSAKGQARTVFRYLIETCEAALACAGDEKIFAAFSAPPLGHDDQARHWRRSLSPRIVRDAIAAIELELGFEKDLLSETQAIRQQTYAWLSRFSHVDLFGYAASAVTDAHIEMSLGTLRWTIVHIFFFLITFQKLLLCKHRWFAHSSKQRPDARQCDFQEKLCFILVNRFKDRYLEYRRTADLPSVGESNGH
jgi:hypothetical protein